MSEEPTSKGTNQDDQLSRWLLLFGLLLVASALVLYSRYQRSLTAPQETASTADTDAPVAPPPSIRGQAATNFSLPDLDGKTVSRADFKDKIILVNFWATWCSPCLIEIPWFVEFQNEYGPKGFQVVAISMDEEGPKVVKQFAERHGMQDFKVLMGNQNTPDQFGGLLGLPTTFIIDRNGNYYSKHQGLVSRDDIEDELRALFGDPEQPAASSPTSQTDSSVAGNTLQANSNPARP